MQLDREKRHESKKLRESARGQQCMVRLPGVCNFNRETTVLAHLNGAGMGVKHSDWLGAFACSNCHDELDRRTRTFSEEFAQMAHYEGIFRTQAWWLDHEYLELP